jgi:hypothetical protein
MSRSLVPVHVFEGPVGKAMLPEILADEGIPCVVEDHSIDLLEIVLRPQKGRGRLLVPKEHKARAEALIAEWHKATAALLETSEE